MKQRVYKKNRDVLMQLDRIDRIDKVEQTVGEVVGDYERLLRALTQRAIKAEDMEEDGVENGNGNGEKRERGKRKVVEDEEDEEGMVPVGDGVVERERKRVKKV